MDVVNIEQAARAYCDARSAWAAAYALTLEVVRGTTEADALQCRVAHLEGVMLSRADALAEAVLSQQVADE